ncbi:MAG: hypothetical protein FWF29_10570 [Treponema sp.]|nr:hypothetical protein [Treponema sp.]
MMPQKKFETRAEKRKDIIQLEERFLSAVLSNIDTPNLSEIISRYSGVSWRQFLSKQHQALWRALQTLDLAKSIDERVDILLADKGLTREDLSDNLGLTKQLYTEASGITWVERKLTEAEVLKAVGGKAYVRKICPKHQMMDSFMEEFARRLKFAQNNTGERE